MFLVTAGLEAPVAPGTLEASSMVESVVKAGYLLCMVHRLGAARTHSGHSDISNINKSKTRMYGIYE